MPRLCLLSFVSTLWTNGSQSQIISLWVETGRRTGCREHLENCMGCIGMLKLKKSGVVILLKTFALNMPCFISVCSITQSLNVYCNVVWGPRYVEVCSAPYWRKWLKAKVTLPIRELVNTNVSSKAGEMKWRRRCAMEKATKIRDLTQPYPAMVRKLGCWTCFSCGGVHISYYLLIILWTGWLCFDKKWRTITLRSL